ncbi:MAG: glycosyltransferase [Candidatus Scalindua sp.]|nr:glycosyltransferase [Candidatus Scalindua sp.]
MKQKYRKEESGLNNPVVSIIMSVYNEQAHVGEAVESILNQTFNDFEFIILNDGSLDLTQKILEKYKQKDPRIKVYNQKNIGLTKSLNKAIGFANGRYIARFDADEISVEMRLEKQVAFLDAHPEIGMVGSSCRNIKDTDGKEEDWVFPSENDKIRSGLIRNNMFNHGSVMIRKEVLDSVGLYNESFYFVQDYELWGRVAKNFKVFNLPEILLIRKVTRNSISQQRKNMKQIAILHIKAQLSVIRNLNPSIFAYLYLIKGFLHFAYWALFSSLK